VGIESIDELVGAGQPILHDGNSARYRPAVAGADRLGEREGIRKSGDRVIGSSSRRKPGSSD
jgi:hypothetical protein